MNARSIRAKTIATPINLCSNDPDCACIPVPSSVVLGSPLSSGGALICGCGLDNKAAILMQRDAGYQWYEREKARKERNLLNVLMILM